MIGLYVEGCIVNNKYQKILVFIDSSMAKSFQSLDAEQVRRLYSDKRIINEILRIAEGKEVAGSFGGTGYSKRPDVLNAPGDLLDSVSRGVTSFHISEETWQNPLLIGDYAERNALHELRSGWDLVLDIDCDEFAFSQIATEQLIQTLRTVGIQSISVKFSGNHGFHIGVPFQAFPQQVGSKKTAMLFPDLPKRIASLLKELTTKNLRKALLEKYSIAELTERSGKEISSATGFDPFSIIEIDTVFLASRHLFRSVYSFNEKSGLVSIPVPLEQVVSFDRKQATVDNVLASMDFLLQYPFLDRTGVESEDGRDLMVLAMDHKPELNDEVSLIRKQQTSYDEFSSEERVPTIDFPPCIHKILEGLVDGRKRAIFILRNFLNIMNWTPDEIKEAIKTWNESNAPPLRATAINTQLRYLKPTEKILPPNCKEYYEGIGVCQPDRVCQTIKNPVAYAKKKYKRKQYEAENNTQTQEKRTLSEEQKEKMKQGREQKRKSRERIKEQKENGTFKEQVEY